MTNEQQLIVRQLGLQPYHKVWQAMQHFTAQRNENTVDEVWLLQHEAVFTQGKAGKPEHLLLPSNIPVVHSDRGGQITYHGPGQLICYLLIDVKRHQLAARLLVTAIETIIIDLLATYGINSYAKADAPGVYVEDSKIASLGLKIQRKGSFHGFALNVQMDLQPFSSINPCGYAGLKMSQLSDYIGEVDFTQLTTRILEQIQAKLGYAQLSFGSSEDITLL